MSTFEIKMPKLGESITEGTILSWSVKAGDSILEDDILFEVSTAKVNAEIPSPVSGTILEILYKEGDTVPIGVVVAIMQLEEENGAIETETSKTDITENTQELVNSDIVNSDIVNSDIVNPKKVQEARWYSPVVLKIAKETKISIEELDKISGTGYLERLSKKDINNYIEQKKKGLESTSEKISQPEISVENSNIVIKDMDPIRHIISDRMILSKKVSAHVTTVVEADVTKLVNWRNHQKEAFLNHEGVSLTFMPAIIEATAKSLIEFPEVNASVDGYKILLKKHINIGIAVSLSDGNLIVPVIHDADQLSISGLALATDTLANKARSNKLKTEDIQGGTFTITNFGTFKNIFGTPIINQPEVAILGVGYIEKKPAVIETPEGDVIAIRHKMYLSLSYDHRIINGAVGGAFLRHIADYLENWEK
jgi:2-oxoglutarate dehydrogenase E2 component (dihydrolipoamide succinyltransferase)